ncbi:unnamed protein product, partial [Phaeothamnion confervicola]
MRAKVWEYSGQEWFNKRWDNIRNDWFFVNARTGEVRYSEPDACSVTRFANSFWQPVVEEEPEQHGAEDQRKKRLERRLASLDLRASAAEVPLALPDASAALLSPEPRGDNYRTRWAAAVIVQRMVRGSLSRWRVARALVAVFARTVDETGYYAFQNPVTGVASFHKPPGMGLADLWHDCSIGSHDNALAVQLTHRPLLALASAAKMPSTAQTDGGGVGSGGGSSGWATAK